MNIKNHFIFSIFFVFFLVKLYTKFFYKVDLLHIICGSLITFLLPDIDHPNSYIGNRFKYVSIIIYKIFGHRNITHSIFGLIIFLLFLIYINNLYLNLDIDVIVGMFLGYLSHIIADIFTSHGVKLFWPFKIRVRFFFKNKFFYVIFMLFFCFLFFKLF